MDWWNTASSIQRYILIIAWIAWFGLLFGGFFFGKLSDDQSRRMPRWSRMGASLALVIAGWVWVWEGADSPARVSLILIASGMTWGLIGDLAMANLLPIRERVLGGIGAFGIGHLCYIAGLWYIEPSAYNTTLMWISWGTWLILGLIGWYLVVWRTSEHKTVHKLTLPYALLLASTTGIATGLSLNIVGFWPLAVGAGLFLFSDLLLASQLFNKAHFRLISDIVWLLYSPGQMLIIYSMGQILKSSQGIIEF